MMAYLRQWRKCTAEVNVLAQSSSSDEQDTIAEDQYTGTQCISHDEEDTSLSSDHLDQQLDSDYGFSEGVESSSDSEASVLDAYVGFDSDNPDEVPDLGEEIAMWATKNKCTRTALNEMLDILRRHGHRLPKDARTPLETPRLVQDVAKCGGRYVYFGIETGILRNVTQYKSFAQNNDCIQLCVNIDGAPLFKSTNVHFWPILYKFDKFEPFVAALFCGKAKPDPLGEFLPDFLLEFQQLKVHGITHDDKKYNVTIKAFICDAPVRAYLKCV